MDSKLFKELKSLGRLNKVKSPDGSHFISCPHCQNKMLRSWDSEKGCVSLCYECGCLFMANSGRVLKVHKGDCNFWGAESLATINLEENKEIKYKSKNPEERLEELGEYLRLTQEEMGLTSKNIISKISNEEIVEAYTTCSDCGSELLTSEELHCILKEVDTPDKTLEIISEKLEDHQLNAFLENHEEEYSELDYGEDTWRLNEKYPSCFVSPEMREWIANLVAKEYALWVDEGVLLDVDHDEDPPWDCSGELTLIPSTKAVRIQAFETIGEWMANCLTGETVASYESGHGFYHQIVEDEMIEFISDKLYEVWVKKMSDEERKVFTEDISDKFQDATTDAIMSVIELVSSMSVIDAYKRKK